MANAIYPRFKQELLQGTYDMSAGNIKVLLVDTGAYTYSSAHQFHSSVAGAAILATSGNLAAKTFVDGVFDADNVTFSSVTATTAEALIIYLDTGVSGTSPLIAYLDTGFTGLPTGLLTGGDVTVTWNASGIFSL